MSRPSKFLSLAAAFLIAAAFSLMVYAAPLISYADTTTTHTAAATYLDEFVNHFGLENPWAQPTGGASFVGMGTSFGLYPSPCIVVVSDCSTSLDNSGNLSCSGTGYYRLGSRYGSGSIGFTYYPGGGEGNGAVRFAFGSNVYNYSVRDGDYNEYYPTLISVTFPATSDVLNNFDAWRRKLVTPTRTGGIAMITGGGDGVTVASSMRNVANTIRAGNMALTTTTTITTTTTTTTTTVTLPPYPYQTSPPFELPSDWTADYSETVPVPSSPAFTTAAIQDVDDALDGADSNFLSAIGFWFLVLGEILNDYPLLVYMIVFTIAILLLVGLLYNGGGDDK